MIYIDSSLKNVILINTRENTLLSNDNQQQIENPLKFGFNVSKSQLQSEKKMRKKGKLAVHGRHDFTKTPLLFMLHAQSIFNAQREKRRAKRKENKR